MSQHMEKGLKGVFKTGSGGGDLPSVPNLSDVRVRSDNRGGDTLPELLVVLLSCIIGLTGIFWVARL